MLRATCTQREGENQLVAETLGETAHTHGIIVVAQLPRMINQQDDLYHNY